MAKVAIMVRTAIVMVVVMGEADDSLEEVGTQTVISQNFPLPALMCR